MIKKSSQTAATVTQHPSSQNHSQPSPLRPSPIILFAIPKPFVGDADRIQRNAINSWRQLTPDLNVVLFGDDPGTAESALELGVEHITGIAVNDSGTPLVSSAFRLVQERYPAQTFVYCNCDVILFEDFVAAVRQLENAAEFDTYVGIGRRTDLDVKQSIDFECDVQSGQLRDRAIEAGTPSPVVCKEYFVFPRGAYDNVPAFAVGRGNWDNWMVANAKSRGIPVVNMSAQAMALHQQHDYGHISQNRLECYVTGNEARTNQELAGGKNIVSGATTTWVLGEHGVRKRRFSWLHGEFWCDSLRFAGLLANLIRSR